MRILQRLLARREAGRPRVSMDDTGITRWLPDGKVESVRWDDLQSVAIVTNALGPWVDDLSFVLRGSGDEGCVVPQGEACRMELLPRLQALPGFDNLAVVAAMGSTGDAFFPCWSRASRPDPSA
ncbi:MAG: hypothetical protein U0166_26500, partial [Acidobacteriota bacterium]